MPRGVFSTSSLSRVCNHLVRTLILYSLHSGIPAFHKVLYSALYSFVSTLPHSVIYFLPPQYHITSMLTTPNSIYLFTALMPTIVLLYYHLSWILFILGSLQIVSQ